MKSAIALTALACAAAFAAPPSQNIPMRAVIDCGTLQGAGKVILKIEGIKADFVVRLQCGGAA